MKTRYSSNEVRSYLKNYNSFYGLFSLIARTIMLVLILLFPASAFAQSATLSLSPSQGTLNRGCNYSITIDLNTGGAQTDGTDAILIYDTARLSASSITQGTIYTDYPGNNIDSQTGKITVSGLSSVSTPFSGQGTLATIYFTVKEEAATGATQISFDFDPNVKSKTTDSNVVERGTIADILNSTVNGNYTIGSGSCSGATSPGSTKGGGTLGGGGTTSTPSGQIPYKTLPTTGTAELTATITIVGAILTILGILGLALL